MLRKEQPVKFIFCTLAPIEMAFSLRMLANPSAYPEMSTWAKRKFDSLSTGLKNEIMFFNDHFQWYFIADLIVDLIAEEEVCVDDIFVLIERLKTCSKERFLYVVLGLTVENIEISYIEKIVKTGERPSEEFFSKATKFISEENVEYLLKHIEEVRNRLIDLVERSWTESFYKDWRKIRGFENDTIRMEQIKYQHEGPSRYLSTLHPDLIIKDKMLIFNRPGDTFSIPVDKIKTVVIKPSVFAEDRLNGNIVDSKVTITKRLNFHTVMTASPAPINLSMVISILNDPSRLRIVKVLWNYDSTTKELAEILNLSPTTVSLHLKQMKKNNFVTTQKMGKYVYYQLRKDQFYNIDQKLQRYLRY